MLTGMSWRVAAVALACAVVVAGVAVEWPRRSIPAPPPSVTPIDPSPAPATAPAPATRTVTVELKARDTFVRALARAGIDAATADAIARRLRQSGADLRRLRPGTSLVVTWMGARLGAVAWEASPWLAYTVEATPRGWDVRTAAVAADVRVAPVRGEVQSSLWDAVEDTRESPQLVPALVDIFASDFDFTADTQPGDRFRLLVEKRHAGDRFVEYGRILVAQYLTEARTFTGVSWPATGRGRPGYYDPAGRSLRKSFLRSPLAFTRITSGFTHARPHPILGGVRPHLAIDYGAPAGTPVHAVAEGTVRGAGWDGGNGLSVLLQHRSGYRTMYNHLSRLGPGVERGARVAQQQVIGYVGMTGLATGPHLDFRVARNGVWVNPLNEPFLPGEPISIVDRHAFLGHAQTLMNRLEREAGF